MKFNKKIKIIGIVIILFLAVLTFYQLKIAGYEKSEIDESQNVEQMLTEFNVGDDFGNEISEENQDTQMGTFEPLIREIFLETDEYIYYQVKDLIPFSDLYSEENKADPDIVREYEVYFESENKATGDVNIISERYTNVFFEQAFDAQESYFYSSFYFNPFSEYLPFYYFVLDEQNQVFTNVTTSSFAYFIANNEQKAYFYNEDATQCSLLELDLNTLEMVDFMPLPNIISAYGATPSGQLDGDVLQLMCTFSNKITDHYIIDITEKTYSYGDNYYNILIYYYDKNCYAFYADTLEPVEILEFNASVKDEMFLSEDTVYSIYSYVADDVAVIHGELVEVNDEKTVDLLLANTVDTSYAEGFLESTSEETLMDILNLTPYSSSGNTDITSVSNLNTQNLFDFFTWIDGNDDKMEQYSVENTMFPQIDGNYVYQIPVCDITEVLDNYFKGYEFDPMYFGEEFYDADNDFLYVTAYGMSPRFNYIDDLSIVNAFADDEILTIIAQDLSNTYTLTLEVDAENYYYQSFYIS